MKKIITLEIFFDEDKKMINAEIKHSCDSIETALQVIQEFIDRKSKKGGKSDA